MPFNGPKTPPQGSKDASTLRGSFFLKKIGRLEEFYPSRRFCGTEDLTGL